MNIIEYLCHGVAGRLGHALDVQRVQQRCCEIQPDHCYQTTLIVAVHTITVSLTQLMGLCQIFSPHYLVCIQSTALKAANTADAG